VKGFFSRIENWLLIVPLILLLAERSFFAGESVDLHFQDTYIVIPSFYIGIAIFLFCWLPYLCHFALRAKKKGDRKILMIHVITTVLLLSALFVYNLIDPGAGNVPRGYYDYSSWQSYRQFNDADIWFAIMFSVFVSIQILFMLYAVIRLLTKK
jgi:cytochrome c oxidase subunit 1